MTAGRFSRAVEAALAAAVLVGAPMEAGAQRAMRAQPSGLMTRPESAVIRRGPQARLRSPDVPAPDRWFGQDKIRHAGSAFAIQLMGFGLLRLAGVSRSASFVGASLVTVGASVGKEVHDARHGGDPSARDLVWDAVGLALGTRAAAVGDPR